MLLITLPTVNATFSTSLVEDQNRKLEPWLKDKVQNLIQNAPDREISLVVRAKDNKAKHALADTLKNYADIKNLDVLDSLPVILVKAKASSVEKLASNPLVKHIGDGEAKVKAFLDVASSTVSASQARATYDVDGEGVTIAILDTGIDETHPDLDDLDDDPSTTDPKVIYEISFVPNEDPNDYYGHGTYVAGIAAGTGQASNGTYKGIAPKANLVNVKVLNSGGWGEIRWVINGIDWVISHRAQFNIRVVSMSLGTIYYYPPLYGQDPPYEDDGTSEICQAADDAVAAGLVVCVAQGNLVLEDLDVETPRGLPAGGWLAFRPPASPAAAFNVIAVGGIDDKNTPSIADDTMWRGKALFNDVRYRNVIFSRAGPTNTTSNPRTKPDVVAPAKDIISCYHLWQTSGNYYRTASGTSAATPMVAGIAALMIQKYPELTPKQVKDILKSTAELNNDLANTYNSYRYGAENIRGNGIVNATQAISVLARLTVSAKDQYNMDVGMAEVYIDGEFVGYSCRSYAVIKGDHTVEVAQVFWSLKYKYAFQHWEDGTTANPRMLTISTDITITAYYQKTYWPYPIPR